MVHRARCNAVDMEKGLNFDYLIQISNKINETKRSVMEEAIMARVKDTAMKEGMSGVVQDVNKSRARKHRREFKEKGRQHTLLRSNQVNKFPNMDVDKKYFLQEFLKLIAFSEMYYRERQFVAFYNTGMTVAFIAVQVNHFGLANKVYSMFGQMLLVSRQHSLALEMFSKMRNCAHTAKDIIVKMYAYKQMG